MIITRKCWHFVPLCGGLHHGYLASQLSQGRKNMKDRLGEIDKHEQKPLKMTCVCFREGREEQDLNVEWIFLVSNHSRRQTWLLQMHVHVPLLFVVERLLHRPVELNNLGQLGEVPNFGSHFLVSSIPHPCFCSFTAPSKSIQTIPTSRAKSMHH